MYLQQNERVIEFLTKHQRHRSLLKDSVVAIPHSLEYVRVAFLPSFSGATLLLT